MPLSRFAVGLSSRFPGWPLGPRALRRTSLPAYRPTALPPCE